MITPLTLLGTVLYRQYCPALHEPWTGTTWPAAIWEERSLHCDLGLHGDDAWLFHDIVTHYRTMMVPFMRNLALAPVPMSPLAPLRASSTHLATRLQVTESG